MDLKPTRGLRVTVNAKREAVFGDESVSVNSTKLPEGKGREGVLTGTVLAGYAEVEMPSLDGKKHWYPVDSLDGERGEKVVEEEVQVDLSEDDDEEAVE
jgi:hypothetical protein